MANEDLIKKWLSGELSDAEKKEFESTEEFVSINKLMVALKAFKAPGYNVNKEYQRLSEKALYKKRIIPLYDRISPVLKIAAVFIIALTIGYFSRNYFNSDTEDNGWISEQTEVYLPDSSVVSLNAGSRIKFSEKKWGKERSIELHGEAFFRVKEGSRFDVKSTHGTVTVLGTEFDVKDWENYYEVSCYSGLVKVFAEQNSIVLKPNSAFRIVKGTAEHYTFTNKSEPDWLNGESSFRSVPFSFVINELERQYKISVEINSIDLNLLFTGGFSHNNLELALESITTPVNLNYEIDGNKIVISFEDK